MYVNGGHIQHYLKMCRTLYRTNFSESLSTSPRISCIYAREKAFEGIRVETELSQGISYE